MRSGRPPQYDLEQALDAAVSLFWHHGFEATSLHDLTSEMQLSKSSLYALFGSKKDLFLRCIQRYREATVDRLDARREAADSGLEFIEHTFKSVVEEAGAAGNPRGCLITNTAHEIGQSDTEVARNVADGFAGFRLVFYNAILAGCNDGSVRDDTEPEMLANYLVSNMNGLRIMVKAGTEPAVLANTVDVIVDSVRKKKNFESQRTKPEN